MKGLKVQSITAVIMTLVVAIIIGTSTYAWYAMNAAVTAAGVKVQAKAETGVVIANEAYESWTSSADSVTQKIGIFPSSTADFAKWYHAVSKNANDAQAGQAAGEYTEVSNDAPVYNVIAAGTAITSGTVLYVKNATSGAYSPKVISGTSVPKDYTYYTQKLGINNYYSLSRFYIRSATGVPLDATLYIKKVTVSGATDTQSLNKALRVGVKLNSSTTAFIFAPVAGSTLTYKVKGDTNVTAIDASKSETEALNTNTGVTSIPATDSGLYADIYVWFEGEDAACTSNNVVALLDNLSISVQFASEPSVSVVQVGNVMKAKALTATSAGAASYQWKTSTSADGTFTEITGQTSDTLGYYYLTDQNYYKCDVTYGTKTYTNATATKYERITIKSQKDGTSIKLTVTPSDKIPTAYQWYVANSANGTWSEVATAEILENYDKTKYYYCDVTILDGIIESPVYHDPIVKAEQYKNSIRADVSYVPEGADASYQWSQCATADGTYEDCTGATATKATIVQSDLVDGVYYKCSVSYGSETYTSAVAVQFAEKLVSVVQSGNDLVASAANIVPDKYQWMCGDSADGTFTEVTDGGDAATIAEAKLQDGKYYKCVVTEGIDTYTNETAVQYLK